MLHSLCVMMTCHGIHMDIAQVRLAVQYTIYDMAQLVSNPSVIIIEEKNAHARTTLIKSNKNKPNRPSL